MSFRTAQIVCVALVAVGVVASIWLLATGEGSVLASVPAVCALVAVGAGALAQRRLRDRAALSERRSRDLQQRIARLERTAQSGSSGPVDARQGTHEAVTYAALLRLDEQLRRLSSEIGVAVEPGAGVTPRVLPETLLVRAAEAVLDDAGPLETDRLVQAHGLRPALPLKTLRVLARGLRDRGYLVRAHEYFSAAAAFGDERDVRTLRLRQAELDVLSGQFHVAVPTTDPVVPVPGRVLHVVGRAVPGTQSGYTLRTQSTARAQLELGWEPHVFVQLGITDSAKPSTGAIDGVIYHRPTGRRLFDVGHVNWLQANAEALLDVVLDVRPSVIHAHSDFYNAQLARAVATATGLPMVYEARGFWEESWLSRTADKYAWDADDVFQRFGVPEAYSWRLAREADARASADHVVTLARVMRTRITEAGVQPDRVTIVPNAVDVDRFHIDSRAVGLARSLGIPDDVVVVGCVTSVVEYEGIDALVDACTALVKEGVPVWLLVVGDGPVLASLEARAEHGGLTNVTFTGRVPHGDVLDYYSIIDIFAVPRRPSAVSHLVTPLKPFEAFAAARAVVLSDVGALREIASDSGAADLFAAGDTDDLAETIRRLVAEPERRASLAATGASWVRAHRSWSANAELYEATYRRVLPAE